MKKLLNTLYVTTPDAYLSKDGTNLVVSVKGVEKFRIPVQNVEAVCCFGYQGASPGAMRLCVDNNVGLTFFTPDSRFVARVQGRTSGNVLLRHRQYGWHSSPDETSHLSSLCISAKINNSRTVLRRFVRDYRERPDAAAVEEAASKLDSRIRMALKCMDTDRLRGIEGEAATIYFGVLSKLILNRSPAFGFAGRNRRPPTDAVNAMLSLGYSLLASQCASALEGVGLDPGIGFMHTMRPGRDSLALDICEELRAYVVDRFVISIVNNRQITPADFKQLEAPSADNRLPVILTDEGRRTFLAAWQARKKTELTHPFLGEKIQLGLLPHVQALLLARYLRGDLDDYPVFIYK